MLDVLLPLIILLGVLFLMLWALGMKRTLETNARLDRIEQQRRVDVSCQDAQARVYEGRLVNLELRTFANSRDIVSLANELADLNVDPRERKATVSPAPVICDSSALSS